MLTFEERSTGFRVVRDGGYMVAALETKRPVDGANGVVEFHPLPRGECTIHSAGGPLTVADIEEMLAHLPKE